MHKLPLSKTANLGMRNKISSKNLVVLYAQPRSELASILLEPSAKGQLRSNCNRKFFQNVFFFLHRSTIQCWILEQAHVKKLQFISCQATSDKMWTWTSCGWKHNWPWPVFNYVTFSINAWFKSRIVPTTFCRLDRLIKVLNILENYSWSYLQAPSILTGL